MDRILHGPSGKKPPGWFSPFGRPKAARLCEETMSGVMTGILAKSPRVGKRSEWRNALAARTGKSAKVIGIRRGQINRIQRP